MFVDPIGIAVAANGDLYVADESAHLGSGMVLRVDPVTGAQDSVRSGGSFVDPLGIAFEPGAGLVIVDPNAYGGGGGVTRVDPASGAQVPLASGGSFSNPTGIAVVGALTVPARRATWGEVKARYAR